MEEWKLIELYNACSRLSSGKNISAINVGCEGIYPVYGGNGLRGYTDSYNFNGDCAIIGRQGAYCGNVRYFSGKAYMTEHAVVACGNDISNTRFLSYLLSSMQLGRLSGQSAQPGLSVKTLGQQLIKLPSLRVQNIIAETLGILDEKIEANECINKNLEEQAQTIFKAWFVDFESFGEVMPDDWTEESVYNLAEYINGAAFKKNEYSTEGLPIIKIAELKNGITDSTQYCCVEKDEKYYLDNKDILFSWSGNPETSIDTFLWYRGKAILNQHTFHVISKYNAPAFTYFLLKYLKPTFTHIASNKQTTGLGHVTVADLKRLQFPFNLDAIEEFEKLAQPLFDMIYNTCIESNQLAELRDTLLPKLMSGELDVSEIEI